MKVRELIAELKKLDPDLELRAQDCSYCEGQEEPYVGVSLYQDYATKETYGFVRGIPDWERENEAKRDALPGELT